MSALRSLHQALVSTAIVASSLLLLLPEKAQADEYHDRCVARGSTSTDFAICGNEWVKREEAALALTWRRVYGSFEPGPAKTKLLGEQRLWISYKDAACGLFSDSQSFGSIGWAIELPSCRAQVIRDRIELLNSYQRPQ